MRCGKSVVVSVTRIRCPAAIVEYVGNTSTSYRTVAFFGTARAAAFVYGWYGSTSLPPTVHDRAGSSARWEPISAPCVNGLDVPSGATSSTLTTHCVSAVFAFA